MPLRNWKSQATRDTVLRQLAAMAEGRHPDCKTITRRFIRDPELQQASKILGDAIQAEYYGRAASDVVPPPPAWLLPA
jgi:hypothetical protein